MGLGDPAVVQRARLTTRKGSPRLVLDVLRLRPGEGRAAVRVECDADFYSAHRTVLMDRARAEDAAASVPMGARGFVAPVDDALGVAWAVQYSRDFDKELLSPAFLVADGRFVLRSRLTDAPVEEHLLRAGWRRADSPEEYDPDSNNFRVLRRGAKRQVQSWPVPRRVLEWVFADELLNRVFWSAELYSKPFALPTGYRRMRAQARPTTLAEEVIAEEIFRQPRYQELVAHGLLEVETSPFVLKRGFASEEMQRIRFRGYRSTVQKVYDDLFWGARRELFTDPGLPGEVRPGAAKARGGGLPGADAARWLFPAQLLIDLERPVGEQSALHRGFRSHPAIRGPQARRTLDALVSDAVLGERLVVLDQESDPSWFETLPEDGEIDDAAYATRSRRVLLTSQDPGVASMEGFRVVVTDDELSRVEALNDFDYCWAGGQNIIRHDWPMTVWAARPFAPGRMDDRVSRERRRRALAGAPMSDLEVIKRYFHNDRRRRNHLAHGYRRSESALHWDPLKLDMFALAQAWLEDVFPGRNLEGLTGSQKVESHAEQRFNKRHPTPERLQQDVRYLAHDVLDIQENLEEALVSALSLSAFSGRDVEWVTTHAPHLAVRAALQRDEVLRRRVDPEARFASRGAQERREQSFVAFRDVVPGLVVASCSPRFGRFFVGTPCADLEVWAAALARNAPELAWLRGRFADFSTVYGRLAAVAALRGLTDTYLSATQWLYGRAQKELGTSTPPEGFFGIPGSPGFSRLVRAERMLERRLEWGLPETGRGPENPIHHGYAYGQRLSERLAALPTPLVVSGTTVVSDSPKGLLLYEPEPVPGVLLDERSALLLGSQPLAIGVRAKTGDPAYALLDAYRRGELSKDHWGEALRNAKDASLPAERWQHLAHAVEETLAGAA